MQNSASFKLALVVSVVWIIAAGNAGMHLAVAPATSAYRHCIESRSADEAVCLRNLHLDWEAQSGNRIPYAVLGAFAPLPILWLMAYAIMSGRREARPRPYSLKVFPAKSVA